MRSGVEGKGLIVYRVMSTASVTPAPAASTTASETWVSGLVEVTMVMGTCAWTAPEPSSTETVSEPAGPFLSVAALTDRTCPSRVALTPSGMPETA